MIEFFFETEFKLEGLNYYSDWINRIINSEQASSGSISYIFCDDAYLLEINKKYLGHDYFTDIITFDYCEGIVIEGDIFISINRVRENALLFNVTFEHELRRVMAHGVLHLLGYDDKVEDAKSEMRKKENEKLKMFHVEQS